MFSFIVLIFVACLVITFFPLILAGIIALAAIAFCLVMAAWCWIRNLFTPAKRPIK